MSNARVVSKAFDTLIPAESRVWINEPKAEVTVETHLASDSQLAAIIDAVERLGVFVSERVLLAGRCVERAYLCGNVTVIVQACAW